MNDIAGILPIIVILPLGAAFLNAILGSKFRRFGEVLGIVVTALLFVLSLCGLHYVNTKGTLVYNVGAWKPPMGITMVLDNLSVFMLVTISFVAFAIALYSINYMEKYTRKWKFYTLFFMMLAGMNGVIITGDVFNLFVFLELASLSSAALVGFGVERHELEAALKYLVMSVVGSLFILLSIALLYAYTSTLNLANIAVVLAEKGPQHIILMISVFFMMGFGLKSALVPFHAWLPDAHPSAPAPISAMLSGVLIKSLGVYTVCRIFYNTIGMTPALQDVFMGLAVLSMIVGGFLCVGQWDSKRLLAYSSINQMGFIFLGLGLGTPLGLFGAVFHILNHSVTKSLLFLSAGAVDYACETRDMRRLGGLFKKMPVTAATYLTGAMSISGVPPFGGFWSKLIIIVAAVQAGRFGYAVCAVVASVLTLAAVIKSMKYIFFGKLPENLIKIKEVPIYMKVSMCMLAFVCASLGLLLMTDAKSLFISKAASAIMAGTKFSIELFGVIK